MIQRIYVHNFRSLENFNLSIGGKSSLLLLGKNGSGKTTVLLALEKLQRIARGINKVGMLLEPKDFSCGRTAVPMRFEIDVEIEKSVYSYSIAFELPKGFKELRVREEKLAVNGKNIYTRDLAKVQLARPGDKEKEASFFVDWHLVALPVIQQLSIDDPVSLFKDWLGRMLLLRPVPSAINGRSDDETLQPNLAVSNLGAWFTGLLAQAPAAYSGISDYLREFMPDLLDIQNPSTGGESRQLFFQFEGDKGGIKLAFDDLSDGEKCFAVCALVLASNKAYGPLFCFWDEPDNFLALGEIGQLVIALRRSFQVQGQFVATSHNSEAIQRFSKENTLLLYRKSHHEPTVVRSIESIKLNGDLVSAMIRGDLEP